MTAKTAPATPAPPLVFHDAEVPPMVRKASAEPNPFLAPVAALVTAWDDTEDRSVKALVVTVPKTDVDKCKRKISNAGTEVGKSMRVVVGEVDASNASLKFWAVNKITRARKTAEATADIPAPVPAVA